MTRIKHRRPSPAILVAVIALVAALGGSAVAEVATTSKLNKKEKKQTKKIAKQQANKQIDKKASGLSVANADTVDGVDASGFLSSTQRAFQIAADGQIDDFASNVPFLTLEGLPAGTYTVVAKLSIDNDGVAETRTCDLEVPGPNDDEQRVSLPATDTLPVVLATTFTGGAGSSVTLSCNNSNGDNDAQFARIVATLVS